MNPKDPQNADNKENQEGQGQYPDARIDTKHQETPESYLSFMISRARKIAAALYVITDTMEEYEPLRQEIRATSVLLVSKLSTRTGKSFTERRLLLEQVEEIVEKLVSFLEIGATAGLVSEMNTHIIKQQLSLFLSQLSDDRALLSENAVLSLDFLKDTNTLKDTNDSQGHKGHQQKDTDSFDVRMPVEENDPSPRPAEKTPLYKAENKKKQTRTRTIHTHERQKRRDKIVSFITRKKQVTIKDIGGLFKDIGEKTIQRELTALVSDGTIKRVGEKRWSRYLIS